MQKIFLWVWVNCRSGGQWGDGPRGLPFPPLQLLFLSHYISHSQTFNSPSESTSGCSDSQCCCTYTHTHTQRCRNTYTTVSSSHNVLQQGRFFHALVTCSYVSSFHRSTKHPGSLYSPSQGLWGVFIWL